MAKRAGFITSYQKRLDLGRLTAPITRREGRREKEGLESMNKENHNTFRNNLRKNNPEEYRRRRKEERKRHKFARLEQKKKYEKKYPERIKAQKSIYGHRRRGFIIQITSSELETLLKQTKYCTQCGIEFSRPRLKTIDRINNTEILTVQTIQIICLKCNIKNAWKLGIYDGRQNGWRIGGKRSAEGKWRSHEK